MADVPKHAFDAETGVAYQSRIDSTRMANVGRGYGDGRPAQPRPQNMHNLHKHATLQHVLRSPPQGIGSVNQYVASNKRWAGQSGRGKNFNGRHTNNHSPTQRSSWYPGAGEHHMNHHSVNSSNSSNVSTLKHGRHGTNSRQKLAQQLQPAAIARQGMLTKNIKHSSSRVQQAHHTLNTRVGLRSQKSTSHNHHQLHGASRATGVAVGHDDGGRQPLHNQHHSRQHQKQLSSQHPKHKQQHRYQQQHSHLCQSTNQNQPKQPQLMTVVASQSYASNHQTSCGHVVDAASRQNTGPRDVQAASNARPIAETAASSPDSRHLTGSITSDINMSVNATLHVAHDCVKTVPALLHDKPTYGAAIRYSDQDEKKVTTMTSAQSARHENTSMMDMWPASTNTQMHHFGNDTASMALVSSLDEGGLHSGGEDDVDLHIENTDAVALEEQLRLEESIRTQIEYYFSVENLSNDIFLRSRMDADGFVDLQLVASFRRVQSLTSDLETIYNAVSQSQLLEVDHRPDFTFLVRKREFWGYWVMSTPPSTPPMSPHVTPYVTPNSSPPSSWSPTLHQKMQPMPALALHQSATGGAPSSASDSSSTTPAAVSDDAKRTASEDGIVDCGDDASSMAPPLRMPRSDKPQQSCPHTSVALVTAGGVSGGSAGGETFPFSPDSGHGMDELQMPSLNPLELTHRNETKKNMGTKSTIPAKKVADTSIFDDQRNACPSSRTKLAAKTTPKAPGRAVKNSTCTDNGLVQNETGKGPTTRTVQMRPARGGGSSGQHRGVQSHHNTDISTTGIGLRELPRQDKDRSRYECHNQTAQAAHALNDTARMDGGHRRAAGKAGSNEGTTVEEASTTRTSADDTKINAVFSTSVAGGEDAECKASKLPSPTGSIPSVLASSISPSTGSSTLNKTDSVLDSGMHGGRSKKMVRRRRNRGGKRKHHDAHDTDESTHHAPSMTKGDSKQTTNRSTSGRARDGRGVRTTAATRSKIRNGVGGGKRGVEKVDHLEEDARCSAWELINGTAKTARGLINEVTGILQRPVGDHLGPGLHLVNLTPIAHASLARIKLGAVVALLVIGIPGIVYIFKRIVMLLLTAVPN